MNRPFTLLRYLVEAHVPGSNTATGVERVLIVLGPEHTTLHYTGFSNLRLKKTVFLLQTIFSNKVAYIYIMFSYGL